METKVLSLGRYYFVIFGLLLGALGLIWRMIDLNILQRNFLRQQSNARILRVVNIPAYRGMITDRHHQPLAISAQVDSVWVNPQMFHADQQQLIALSNILKTSPAKIKTKIHNDSKEFVYLKRGISPVITEKIKELDIPGVYYQHDYHRFYPQSDVAAHIIGFTNIDDEGQEGLELAYDAWLKGQPGRKKVLKDRMGNIIAELNVVREPRQGHDLTLSIDSRIQYLAYDELKKSLQHFYAKTGSIVVLDIKTGEVLAMVNHPSYNPNHLELKRDGRYRNRAMTDLFEPGSTIKAFSIISALESGLYSPETEVNTSPGRMTINGNIIKDENNYGKISLVKVLQKSSDVGVAKITLALPPQRLWELLHRVGFGERTASSFPGEAQGSLTYRTKWNPFELATLSFGYGLSITPIQLAQAYATIGNQGIQKPISLLKLDQETSGKKVLDPNVAQQILSMLEAVVEGGTGALAKVPGYRVAGKTGTANIAVKGGYDKQHYISSFVGIAPVSNPRVVVVVIIRDPRGEQHLGALVAAPVFSNVMSGALRLLNIPPDDLNDDEHKEKTE